MSRVERIISSRRMIPINWWRLIIIGIRLLKMSLPSIKLILVRVSLLRLTRYFWTSFHEFESFSILHGWLILSSSIYLIKSLTLIDF
jgi:hypothetical protein